MLLTDDLVYFQLAGIFGWGSTPAAFQVVTRAITWELSHSLRSRTVMYVDDIIGICLAEDLDADLAKTRAICTNLLGCGAVADDKTEVIGVHYLPRHGAGLHCREELSQSTARFSDYGRHSETEPQASAEARVMGDPLRQDLPGYEAIL
jgi:hypothetical protein